MGEWGTREEKRCSKSSNMPCHCNRNHRKLLIFALSKVPLKDAHPLSPSHPQIPSHHSQHHPIIVLMLFCLYQRSIKGALPLQASWHRRRDVQGVLQAIHQEGNPNARLFVTNVVRVTNSSFRFLFILCCQVTNMFIEVADAKKEEEAKKNLTKLRDSPRTVDMFMKSFSHKDSKFKTICHADFWTSQIMFALNEDGRLHSLDQRGPF